MNSALLARWNPKRHSKRANYAVTVNDFSSLFVALLAVAGSALLLLLISNREEDAFVGVSHTRDVYRSAQQMLISVARADMSVRSYLLTKEPKYLNAYKQTRSTLLAEALDSTLLARRPLSRYILQTEMWPRLNRAIAFNDELVKQPSLSLVSLHRQDQAKKELDETLSFIEKRQMSFLQKRSNALTDLTEQSAGTRVLLVLIALLTISFSIITLRVVMKKDQAKILSLQAEVDRTKAAELVAYDALTEAHQSNALKAQFMANISHEIRTPMTGILGAAELLNHLSLPDAAGDYSSLLLSSSQELLAVLNDLLNFSRLQRSEMVLNVEPFDLRKAILEVANRNRAAASLKNLSLIISEEPAVPEIVIADQDKVSQILQTLVSNAIKFTDLGGVQISIERVQDLIRITVADTGIGIDEEGLKKLFLPFVQVDGSIRRNFGGAGLSLYIAKRFAQMMDGQIEVLSEPNGGSIFWFMFRTGVNDGKLQSTAGR
ncbi:MAG: ATP-binding protein [Candidatus Obscuribacterales bacterium]|nr:ATP-binding protein [Candidatus Obscuribacterales bacterium]